MHFIMKILKYLVMAVALIVGTAVKAGATEPKVVTSIYPLHALTAGVMAGVGSPVLLLESDLSPHDFALKPSQARLLQEADLIVWIGDGLEYPLARFIENLAPGRSMPLTAPGAANGQDFHIWLDPDRAQQIVSALVDKLAFLDPVNSSHYTANGATLQRRLDGLAGELETLLHPLRAIPYIVFHDAYGHFERRFGLANQGAVTADPERRPGAHHIRRMRAKIVDSGAQCIFREPQFEPQILAAIVEGHDIRIGELDPLGAGLEMGVNGYFQLMRNLAAELAGCLSHP